MADPSPHKTFGDLFTEGLGGELVIIGFPFDEGSIRAGYRRGAELGPDCLRRFLPKIGPSYNHEHNTDLSGLTISDYGNIVSEQGFDGAHTKLRDKVQRTLNKPQIPRVFIIGGSGDTSWSGMLGFLDYCTETSRRPVIIALSPSISVSPLVEAGCHSKSSLRLVLEDARFQSLGGKVKAFAVQGTHVLTEDYQYFMEHAGEVTWLGEIRSFPPEAGFMMPKTSAGSRFYSLLHSLSSTDLAYISIDLSSISSAYCPGVSRPSTVGLTSEEILEIMRLLSKNPQVRCIDIIDYNPASEDWRTGHLVALMLYEYALHYSASVKNDV